MLMEEIPLSGYLLCIELGDEVDVHDGFELVPLDLVDICGSCLA